MARLFKFSGSGKKFKTASGNAPNPFSLAFTVAKGSSDPQTGLPATVYLDAKGRKAAAGFVRVTNGVIPDIWLLSSYETQKFAYDAKCTIPGVGAKSWLGEVSFTEAKYIFAPAYSPAFDGTPLVPSVSFTPTPDVVQALEAPDGSEDASEPAASVSGETIENFSNVAANAAGVIRIISEQPWVPVDSPSFHTALEVPTPTIDDNSNTIASTSFVSAVFGKKAAEKGLAEIFDATITGAPQAPDITEESPDDQVVNVKSLQQLVQDIKSELAGPNEITGLPTYTNNTKPDAEQPVTVKGLQTLVEGGLDYAPIHSPVFYGVPKVSLAADAPAGDEIATAAWVNKRIEQAQPKKGEPVYSPTGIGPWAMTQSFTIKKIPDADDTSLILYAVQWETEPFPAPMVGRRVRVTCKTKPDVYATIGFVYDNINGKKAWLLVTDTPVLGYDLSVEASSIGMHPLLTGRAITQNYYNWQNTFFRDIPTLTKSPETTSYGPEIATTEFVKKAVESFGVNALAAKQIFGLNVQYQPFDWIDSKTNKKITFAKNAKIMLTPGSCIVGGNMFIRSDYSAVNIHKDVISSAISGEEPNPWLYLYVASFETGDPEPIVVDSQSVGEGARNLFEALRTYATNTTKITAARLVSCFPACRSVSQINDEYVYRSNHSDLSKKSSAWNVDGVHVKKNITNTEKQNYYTAEFSLAVTSPVKYLHEYKNLGAFSIIGEISGLYGPLLQAFMAAELRATASTSETAIVADAGSIPGLLVEPKELASVADIVDPGRVMNVGAYGATKMVRGSLMSTPVATGTKDGPYDLMAIIAKKWHGQGSGYRVANSFENMPVGQSNILRVTLDALVGDSNTPKDVVFLNVAIFPHGHKYDRNNSKEISPKAE